MKGPLSHSLAWHTKAFYVCGCFPNTLSSPLHISNLWSRQFRASWIPNSLSIYNFHLLSSSLYIIWGKRSLTLAWPSQDDPCTPLSYHLPHSIVMAGSLIYCYHYIGSSFNTLLWLFLNVQLVPGILLVPGNDWIVMILTDYKEQKDGWQVQCILIFITQLKDLYIPVPPLPHCPFIIIIKGETSTISRKGQHLSEVLLTTAQGFLLFMPKVILSMPGKVSGSHLGISGIWNQSIGWNPVGRVKNRR